MNRGKFSVLKRIQSKMKSLKSLQKNGWLKLETAGRITSGMNTHLSHEARLALSSTTVNVGRTALLDTTSYILFIFILFVLLDVFSFLLYRYHKRLLSTAYLW